MNLKRRRQLNWQLTLAAFRLRDAIENGKRYGVSKDRLLIAEMMLEALLDKCPYIKLEES